ncbi:alpha/beta fold hydrolase [Jannaschia seohaensis]|nr:alpha/beta fold hydrolase [Jannaschia seohaensis]
MRYRFSDCELDTAAHELKRLGQPVHVEPQVFDLILALAEAGGDLVSYDGLMERIWAGRIVSDATIATRVSAARAAVGDNGKRQSVIRTVPRRGIQMAVPVVHAPHGSEATVTVSVPEPVTPQDGPPQEIRYVRSADGVNIAFAVNGAGPPLLRVGHWLTHLDLDWHSPIWRPLLDRLGAHHTVYRYDQRGTGMSDKDFPGKGIEEFVGDLEAVADQAGPEPIPIFTASQGVAVALKFAADYPERVSRLVLYAGYAQGRYRRGTEAARQEAKAHLELVRTGWGQPESLFLKLFTQIYLPSGSRDQVEHLIQMQLASASAARAARLRDIIDHFDVSDILEKVEAPVLLLHGRGDAVHPIEQSEMMARRLPNAVFVPLDTDNHVPLPGSPAWEVILSETERFLQS